MSGDPDALIVTMKRVASTLKAADIPFALAGGFAVYARGGPASTHDVDFLIRPSDVQSAVGACVEAGLRSEHPPEDWLVKVYDGDCLVDLIFRPSEREVTFDMLERAEELPVEAVRMPVLSATDLLLNKLLAFTEHYCDLATVLPLGRALREQIDWNLVHDATAHSPYAEAFLLAAERLGIAPPGTLRLRGLGHDAGPASTGGAETDPDPDPDPEPSSDPAPAAV
ncbi:nucleotidyltransferase family protein [Cryptosporangium aurantiacum]|uniref:Uncharacterized nucleotidyltransferase n=1 Tax=Cryptosporangium aurantiacum TaxID=134849 RepID=A0A1M7RPL6_9ACTN|nr:nucleotidyltransferase family protein [Cryptosporangium aurantiacum]SHN48042.1 Uncharacterised nucleotidyltransferase [Cryptosporangium aurantiacum]